MPSWSTGVRPERGTCWPGWARPPTIGNLVWRHRCGRPYVNTIPTDGQPWFPGDFEMERRIRAFIRWNAVAMVVRANRASPGIGGHLSTYASSAALYEVGFNHFFRGQADGTPGDHVYIQGHASPGIYARAFLEGRFDEADLDRFRLDIDTPARVGRGLSELPPPPSDG
jgi:pyruvate dehydrogenase E1 component